MDYFNNTQMVCSHMQIENLGEKFRDVWAKKNIWDQKTHW